jgi:hypothetical protein
VKHRSRGLCQHDRSPRCACPTVGRKIGLEANAGTEAGGGMAGARKKRAVRGNQGWRTVAMKMRLPTSDDIGLLRMRQSDGLADITWEGGGGGGDMSVSGRLLWAPRTRKTGQVSPAVMQIFQGWIGPRGIRVTSPLSWSTAIPTPEYSDANRSSMSTSVLRSLRDCRVDFPAKHDDDSQETWQER